MLYVKGAPEIVFGLCKKTSVSKEDVDKQLTEYQIVPCVRLDLPIRC